MIPFASAFTAYGVIDSGNQENSVLALTPATLGGRAPDVENVASSGLKRLSTPLASGTRQDRGRERQESVRADGHGPLVLVVMGGAPPRGAGPWAATLDLGAVMADLAFFLLTLALFALIVAIARGTDRM